jgi:hypothetical protein
MHNLHYVPTTLGGYKVEEKLYLGVREQKRLTTTALYDGHIQQFTRQSVAVLLRFVVLGNVNESWHEQVPHSIYLIL